MSILNENQLLGAPAGSNQYQIQRSLRFNSADSAYLSRTPASAGNRKTWTWSGWVKRSAFNASHTLFGAYDGVSGAYSRVGFVSGDVIWFQVGGSASVYRNITAAVYRDPGAWMHIVAALDTTQATASDRVRLWVNGQLQTFATTSYPPLDYASGHINENRVQALGAETDGTTTSAFFPGYLADIHFIDGQALTPASFGETDATTGEWIPKAYTGTYGTNGFKLNFADNSAATAAALGKDISGNGNNWTPNNLSVTAGAGNDSLVDTPTSYGTDTGVGGEVRGNYCTLNPLNPTGSLTFSNGNLDVVCSGTTNGSAANGGIGVSSGKWYWEVLYVAGTDPMVGIGTDKSTGYTGFSADSYAYYRDGTKYNNNSGTAFGATYTTNDIIGVALDMDNGRVWFSKNGTWQASGNPASNLNPAFSGLTGTFVPRVGHGSAVNSSTMTINLGARPFAYTAPSGFKALCDTNLPAPTIVKPSTVMDVALWTGNGSSRSITGIGFSPDLAWIKARSVAYGHRLFDTIRGATKTLVTNGTDAEGTDAATLTAFNSDGFSVGTSANVNENTTTYAAWCWDAGSSTVTNTAGTISSQVRANASAGFSIVTFTSTGFNATVGHGLGVAPSLVILKKRPFATSWPVWHSALAATEYLLLNSAAAKATGPTYWNSTAPTSGVFSIGTNTDVGGGDAMVAYCFAPVAGYSAFGSYTGNGSADGPFVYTGFRPRWVLIKQTNAGTENWILLDSARDTYNQLGEYLNPNTSAAAASTGLADFLSNGFKLRANTGAATNASAGTYIYAAFAESPFQYARAR